MLEPTPGALPPHPSEQQGAQKNTIHTQWQHAQFDAHPPPLATPAPHANGVLQDAQTPASTPTHAQGGLSQSSLGPSSGSNKSAAQLLRERLTGGAGCLWGVALAYGCVIGVVGIASVWVCAHV